MYILGLETSCDETSVAILKRNSTTLESGFLERLNSLEVLANIVSSQIKIHQKYGGIIPELGAREHAQNIYKVFSEALEVAGLDWGSFSQNLAEIKVTTHPGLVSALRVGLEFAKIISFLVFKETSKKVDITEVNHLDGHLFSCFYQLNSRLKTLKDEQILPHLHLLVSGGNTQLILVQEFFKPIVIGQTLDDAAGESLDKIGRMLGLDYPAGPFIDKLNQGLESNDFNLSIALKGQDTLNFSFSGLKTAVRYLVEAQNFPNWKYQQKLSSAEISKLLDLDFLKTDGDLNYLRFIKKLSGSAQTVIVAQLIDRFKKALKKYQPRSIGLSGGVSANSALRKKFLELDQKNTFITTTELTGDNAAMIAFVS